MSSLADLLGFRECRIMPRTEFYCLPQDDRHFEWLRELFQKKYGSVKMCVDELTSLRGEKKRLLNENQLSEEKIEGVRRRAGECITSIVAAHLTKDEILTEAHAQKADWVEYTLGGLLLRVPSFNG